MPVITNLPASKILSRCITPVTLEKISQLLLDGKHDLRRTLDIANPTDKLKHFQSKLVELMDKVCKLKPVTKKQNTENIHPWNNKALREAKHNRDLLYKIASLSGSQVHWAEYKVARSTFQGLNRKSMIEYFSKHGVRDFKNSKKFWQFYKSSIKLKSDASNSDMPSKMSNGDQMASAPEEIASLFNVFFSSITSISLTSDDDCHKFIFDHFKQLKQDNVISPGSFAFTPVTVELVAKFIANIDDSSSPGNAGISPKILKLAPDILAPLYTSIFNSCIENCTVPSEWKSATVTPLFKNKGSISEMTNYRGISVLPPLSKVFEKILNEQIVTYLDKHNILFAGQHGFRKGHSCETALHELISDLNVARDNRLISMLLFIDYRKAFDTVDSNLLLLKLFRYGFTKSATDLVGDYFKCRSQCTKVQGKVSEPAEILLGVPQGSVLGPLFFLLFINDLAYLLRGLSSKLFADDTTIFTSGADLDVLIKDFQLKIKPLSTWCAFNRLDINWSKTFVMFITNKRVSIPSSVDLNGVSVSTVSEFKLLGVTLDNKLNFSKQVSIICRQINSKLFSIKRLFYLSTAVKLQFFKTFILPYFDYCMSLHIYYPKVAIIKLTKCFYLCLYKLFNFIFDSCSPNSTNDVLIKYGLYSFKYRFLFRLLTFTNKLVYSLNNNLTAPKALTDLLRPNIARQGPTDFTLTDHNLRNKGDLDVATSLSRFGDMTFGFIFPKFINLTCLEFINLKPSDFVNRSRSCLSFIFNNFMNATLKQPDKYAIFKKFF